MKSLRVLRAVKKIVDYSRTTHTRDIDLRTSWLGRGSRNPEQKDNIHRFLLSKRREYTFYRRSQFDLSEIINFITLFFPPRYFTPFERSVRSFKNLISPLVRVALFPFLTLYATPNNENTRVSLKQNFFQFCLYYVITCNLSNWTEKLERINTTDIKRKYNRSTVRTLCYAQFKKSIDSLRN